jgi:cytochrome c biogenesis protein CcmG/thiol:disulfide interchange protein DsbE
MRLSVLFWVSLLLLLAGAGCHSGKTILERGAAAPAFSLESLTHGEVTFPLPDRVTVIRFWAAWCPYCPGEMKGMEPVYRELKDKGLEILAINVAQDKKTVTDFVTKLGISYPVLLDPDGSVSRRYGVVGLPTTIFVDAQGRVLGKILGEADTKIFRQKVLQALGSL